jgi:hypothetical protein
MAQVQQIEAAIGEDAPFARLLPALNFIRQDSA